MLLENNCAQVFVMVANNYLSKSKIVLGEKST